MSKIKSKYLDTGTIPGQVNDQAIPSTYTPTNYTPEPVGTENVNRISAHLKGIDEALSTAGGTKVSSLNTKTGDLTIEAGANVTIDNTDPDKIIISSTSATGFTPENVANKATDLTGPNNTKYPTTQAVSTALDGKMTSPMTTGGDLIYGGASGTPTRLANGSAGQVLTSSGGTAAPTWKSPLELPDLSVSSTVLSWDHASQYKAISSNTTFTWTAPTSGSVTTTFIVTNTSASDVTITLPAGMVKRPDFTTTVKAGKINTYTFVYSAAYNKVLAAVVPDMEE